MSSTAQPSAVLLDAGGVFVLPDTTRVLASFSRAGCDVDPTLLPAAHYRAAAGFTTDIDVETDWADAWLGYLHTYIGACGVQRSMRDEAHRHLDSEFADAGLWVEPIEGAREGLAALADAGVRLGVVSNADGLMGQRLASFEICQVGPGPGVPVEFVIDSGNVGVMKPDPRIFHAALDLLDLEASEAWYVGDMPAIDVVGARRAGLRPFLMDPFELHHEADYDRTDSLESLASSVSEVPEG